MQFLRIRLSFFMIAGLMWLFPIGTHAQGWERLPLLSSPGQSAALIDHVALPDNSIAYTSQGAIGRMDQEGKLLWKVDLEGAAPRSITFTNDRLVAIYAGSMERDVTGIREYNFSPEGVLLKDTAYALRTFSEGPYQEFAAGETLHLPDGGLAIFQHYRVQTIQTNPGLPDTLHYFRLDASRQIIRASSFTVGEYFRLQSVVPLPDDSYGMILGIDTIYDGTTINNIQPTIPVHFQEDGTFTILDDFTDEFRSNPFLSVWDDFELMMVQRDFGGPVVLSRYDFLHDTLIDRTELPTTGSTLTEGLLRQPDGGFVLLEELNSFVPNLPRRIPYFRQFDANFNLTFANIFPFPSLDVVPDDKISQLSDGGFFFSARSVTPFIDFTPVVRTDSEGNTFPGRLEGTLQSATVNCETDPDGTGLERWWLRIIPQNGNGDTLYTVSGTAGDFAVRIDSGAYELQAIPPNAYWESCPPILFTVGPGQDTVTLAPGGRVAYDCSLLTVGISAGYQLERCEENRYAVTYENRGTTTSAPALLRVTLDSFFNPSGSFPAWDIKVADTLFFNLPPIPVGGTGSILINGSLDCTETLPLQYHCTEVHVFPDSLCTPPGINWDGSSLEVSGRCENDTVYFEIFNVAPVDMTNPTQYVITEDIVLHFGGNVELPANSSQQIAVPATSGATYRLEVEQPVGHPGSSRPSITVEGCGVRDGEDFSHGILGQYPQDDGDPFVSLDCTQNNGADPDGLLPNAPAIGRVAGKDAEEPALICRVSPSGIGPEHLIDTHTVLRYTLAYRNLTTDTIRSLLLTDTLPGTLDIATILPTAESTAYDFTVTPLGIARFSIPSLHLPPGQNGFLQFTIRQSKHNTPGTTIINRAAVAFGAGPMQVSNEVTVMVRKPERYGFITSSMCELAVEDLPDFFRDRDTLVLPGYDSVTLFLTQPIPAYAISIDTSINRGDSLLGIQILVDQEIRDSFLTTNGCDSTLTYFVRAIPPTSTGEASTASGVSFYPNPAGDYAVLVPTAGKVDKLVITDMLGRKYEVATSDRAGAGYLLSLHRLPPGMYVLSGWQANGPWSLKFSKW